MKTVLLAAAALPLLALASQPASAAEDLRELAATGRNTAAFAGLSLRMNFGDGRPAAPAARFRMGLTHYYHGGGNGGLQGIDGSSVELGLSARGDPQMFIAGQPLGEIQQRLGAAPAAAAVLGVGALAVGALAASGSSGEDRVEYPEVVCLAIGCPELPKR